MLQVGGIIGTFGVLLAVALAPLVVQVVLNYWRGEDQEDKKPQQDKDDPTNSESDGSGSDDEVDDNSNNSEEDDDSDNPGMLFDGALVLGDDDSGSESFFAQWLDPCMQLSTGCFEDWEDLDLTLAQQRMMKEIADSLQLQPGMRVLEIECGWGECACYLSRMHGVQVTGVSRDETRVLAAMNRPRGEDEVVAFFAAEVAEMSGRFDRIIRIALSEIASPVPEDLFCQLLKDDGMALVHHATSPFESSAVSNDLFDITTTPLTRSFAQTLQIWTRKLHILHQQGDLDRFKERSLEWQKRLERLSLGISSGARKLNQLVYTKFAAPTGANDDAQ